MKKLIRIRRRAASIVALLGFGLVAVGAAHVNHSRSERASASARIDKAARNWHRQLATELSPVDADAWRRESAVNPLVILEAISVTEPAK